MRNLTEYSDLFILGLMEDINANPHKSTATVQYAVSFNKLIPVLCIYQDFSEDWDDDDRCIFCEQTALLDLCDELHLSVWDANNMIEYYTKISFQKTINDIEYEMEWEEYEQAMADELAWYNYARQMGWE